MHRVSQEAVEANLSRMYRDMAQRLRGHAKAGKPISVAVQPSFAGKGMLLIADVGLRSSNTGRMQVSRREWIRMCIRINFRIRRSICAT